MPAEYYLHRGRGRGRHGGARGLRKTPPPPSPARLKPKQREASTLGAADVCVGSRVDVLDESIWRGATVVRVDGLRVLLHIDGVTEEELRW